MKFCGKCENMFYLQLSPEDENQIIYKCRNCGNEDSGIQNKDLCVLSYSKEKKTDYLKYINEFTKLDPTLPRINSIKCPNQDCVCNKDETVENEVIYIRYNDEDMKYVYTCAKCDFIWTAQPI
jgi:DNA-directed RNA polymerase subunit M/transcription elongation factor TFIIS